MIKKAFLLSMILMLGTASCATRQCMREENLMAFLEDRADEAYDSDNLTYVAQIRLALRFTRGEWLAYGEPLPSAPFDWTAVLHGKTLGKVHTVGILNSEWCRDKGLLKLAPDQQLPEAGRRTKEFAGWMYRAVKRPLVLVTKDCFKDGEGWRPVQWGGAVPQEFLRAFRKYVILEEDTDTKTVNLTFQDSDLETCNVYQSRFGDTVAEVRFREDSELFRRLTAGPYLYKVKGASSLSLNPNSFWFGKSGGESQPRYLGDEMALLDIGDFDRNGRSELVFFFSRENEDGYLIAWNRLKEATVFSWHYH